jgi:hypothetical protein
MADPSEESLDPRFDPRYQRGYAAAPVPTPAPPTPAPEPIAEPELDSLPESDLQIRNEADSANEIDDVPAGRDPFRIALLAGRVALIVIAFAIVIWVLQNPHYFDVTNGDAVMQAWQQLSSTLPPALLVAGLVGLGMWLALGVIDRDQGRRR